MATIPIGNPGVPFLGLIPGGLRVGSMIRIKCQMNAHGNRISINLQGGAALSPRDDVALHLSVRPSENIIVRNHLLNHVWGTEERFGGCPIRPGQHFDLLILAEHAAWKIAVNNQHFCLFNHRIAITKAQYISMDGDCRIDSISLEGDTPGYGSAPSAPPHIPTPAFPHMTPYNPIFAGAPPPPPYTPGPPSYSPGAPPYPSANNGPMGILGPEHTKYHGAGHHPHHPPFPGAVPVYPCHQTNYNDGYTLKSATKLMTGASSKYFGQSKNYVQNSNCHKKGVENTSCTTTPTYGVDNGPQYNSGVKKNSNKAWKYAAGAGAAGLGVYAISRAFAGGSDDNDEADDGGD